MAAADTAAAWVAWAVWISNPGASFCRKQNPASAGFFVTQLTALVQTNGKKQFSRLAAEFPCSGSRQPLKWRPSKHSGSCAFCLPSVQQWLIGCLRDYQQLSFQDFYVFFF
ncbi:MAG: hypothetical protein ACREO1_15520 [Arenimonas sp.]